MGCCHSCDDFCYEDEYYYENVRVQPPVIQRYSVAKSGDTFVITPANLSKRHIVEGVNGQSRIGHISLKESARWRRSSLEIVNNINLSCFICFEKRLVYLK